MNDRGGGRAPGGEPPHDGEDSGPTAIGIAAVLALAALVVIGGYFLLMNLIGMSRTEDCLLSGRRNCAPIEMPAPR